MVGLNSLESMTSAKSFDAAGAFLEQIKNIKKTDQFPLVLVATAGDDLDTMAE